MANWFLAAFSLIALATPAQAHMQTITVTSGEAIASATAELRSACTSCHEIYLHYQ